MSFYTENYQREIRRPSLARRGDRCGQRDSLSILIAHAFAFS